MLKFCVHGLGKIHMKMKVDTPRQRIRVKQKYIVYEIENYPINTAAFFGHVHIVQYLLEECNASTTCKNQWEETPYRSAHWAWNEYRVSDPDRAAKCYACMTVIREYIDDQNRHERHKQLQTDFKRARFLSGERKAAYILAHPALSSVSKDYTLFIVLDKGVHSFWLQGILDETDLVYFESLESLTNALKFRYIDR